MIESPGIYNVLDYSITPTNTASVNTTNLQGLVDDVQDAGGGIIVVPANTVDCQGDTYSFAAPSGQSYAVQVRKQPGLVFLGIGGAPKLKMTTAQDLFNVAMPNGNGGSHVGGITFQDMQFEYDEGLAHGAAVHITEGENIRLVRVALIDCPVGVNFQNCLQCVMLECTGSYSKNTGKVVTVGQTGIELYISGCRFAVESDAVRPGSVGIQVNAAEHLRVANTRFDSFEQGIVISPIASTASVRKLYFNNVSISTSSTSPTIGAAVLIQPAAAKRVVEVVFVGCDFTPSSTGTSYQGPGVYVDGAGAEGNPAIVDQIRFISCRSVGWPGAGLEISVGSAVEVLGGYYCNNGTNSSATFRNGIVIYSPAELVPATKGVRIIGATCNNSIAGLPTDQVYGILLNGVENVYIRDCDLRGNATGALTVSGLFTSNVQVTNCAGYNDIGQVLATSPIGSGATIKNSALPTPYYGPIGFYVNNGGGVTLSIAGNTVPFTSGGFTLSPGEEAVMHYGTAPSFLAVGK